MMDDIFLIILGAWAFIYMSERMTSKELKNAITLAALAIVLRLAWAILVKMWEATPPL